ncbi:MAG: 50S ribosomal protein L11 methyltransferase, partial [Nitrospira sp.]|nr:50S ribosomal protein L11 methyltransferase [Nitrospira sp.]
ALRLGATSALGIDIDSTAIACAKGYARTNHFHDDLEFAVMRLVEVPRQDYSVILANVDRR